MGESKIPFKTNLDQRIAPFRKRKTTPRTDTSKPIRATRVDLSKEKTNRIRWVIKWVLILPLGMYTLVWLLLILFDLFSF